MIEHPLLMTALAVGSAIALAAGYGTGELSERLLSRTQPIDVEELRIFDDGSFVYSARILVDTVPATWLGVIQKAGTSEKVCESSDLHIYEALRPPVISTESDRREGRETVRTVANWLLYNGDCPETFAAGDPFMFIWTPSDPDLAPEVVTGRVEATP